MKRTHSALIGALALTFAGAGFAAGTTGAMGSEPGMSGGSASAQQAPDLSSSFQSTDLIGMKVSNTQNQDLGSISNLIVDKDGKVSHVVLNETGTDVASANKYIVPWERVQLSPGQSTAQLDVNRDNLSSEFAAFDESMTAPAAGEPMSAPPATGGNY